MFASWRVGIIFTAANLTGHAFSTIASQARNAERAVDGSAAALSRLQTIGTAAFATVGVLGVATFMKAADAAGKYQLQMSLLQQQLGATDGQMEAIGKRIVSLSSGSSRTMFGMSDLSVMARSLQQSGLDASQVERLLQPISFAAEIEKLRHGGHLDPGTFAANLGATVKGYHLGDVGREADAQAFADKYTRYASVSKLDAPGLLAYENQAGMIARQSGWKIDDFLTFGAFMSQQGVKPQMIGTMLKNILTNVNPRANLTGHAANAQFAGLMQLGMLNPTDPATAKRYLAFVQQSQRAIGLPSTDMAKMTPKVQEEFAEALLRGSVASKVTGGGLTGLVAALSAAKDNIVKTFGPQQGNAMFLTMLRTVFNLRGAPAAVAMADLTPAGLAKFRLDALHQQGLDTRAAALRGEYEPMKEMFGGMVNSVMVMLGGVTPGGKVTSGGPLDIAGKAMFQIETLIGKIAEWSAANPKLIAQIGTLIGVLGVAGLAAAALAVTGTVIGMIANLALLAPMFVAIGAIIMGPVGIAVGLTAATLAIMYFSRHTADLQHYITKAGTWIAVEGGKLLSDGLHNLVKNGIAGFIKGWTPSTPDEIRKELAAHGHSVAGPNRSWNLHPFSPEKGGMFDKFVSSYWQHTKSTNIDESIVVPYSREYTKKMMEKNDLDRDHTFQGQPTWAPKIEVNMEVHGLTIPEVLKKIEKSITDGVLAASRRSGGTANTQGLLVGGGW